MLSHFCNSVIRLHRNSTTMKIVLMVVLTSFATQIIFFDISENCIRLFIINCFRFIVLAYKWLRTTNCDIDALCVTWRKTLRLIWNLPCCTQSIIATMCKCLPLIDEICPILLNFIRTCALHDSLLIRFVAQYDAVC